MPREADLPKPEIRCGDESEETGSWDADGEVCRRMTPAVLQAKGRRVRREMRVAAQEWAQLSPESDTCQSTAVEGGGRLEESLER